MQYQELSDEQVAELKRPRPVTADQLKELIEKIGRNYDEYLKFLKRRGIPEGEKNLRAEAASVVVGRYLKKLKKSWFAYGEVSFWLGERVKFSRDCTDTFKEILGNENKGGAVKVPEEVLQEGRVFPALVDAPGPDGETQPALSGRFKDLWGRVSPTAEDQAIASLPSLAAILLPRILEVLGSRSGHGSLNADQVEAVQVLLAVAVPEMPVPEHIEELLKSFRDGLGEWRTNLARVRMARRQDQSLPVPGLSDHSPRPTGQSKVTADINRSRGKILLCLYLFVTLAPADSAVTRTGDMNDLLDAVFGPRNNLPTHYRRLLQKAGACLEHAEPRYRVDTDELHSRCRTDNRFKTLTPDELIGMLHSAEDRYARLVPGQRHRPPRFACVLRCRTHHSE